MITVTDVTKKTHDGGIVMEIVLNHWKTWALARVAANVSMVSGVSGTFLAQRANRHIFASTRMVLGQEVIDDPA